MTRFLLIAFTLSLVLSGCGGGAKSSATAGANSSSESHDAESRQPIDPKDRPYLDAAGPFYRAIAVRDFAKAWSQLSSHAKAQMTLNQFKAPTNEREEKELGAKTYDNVTAEKFTELLGNIEKEFGTPKSVRNLHVFSTDAKVLQRKNKEEFGPVESMFAIGAMPDSIPLDIRKASLRGQIATELSPEQLAKAAKDEGISVDELKKDPDFKPYFNLKVVLVEEGGKMLVGYFEFLPPGLMD